MLNKGISGDFKGLPFLTPRVASHTSSVFAGATTDAHGSIGEKPTYTIFTVTGVVTILRIAGVCGTGGAGGSISVGTATNLTRFLATTDADNIDTDEVYAATADPVDKTDLFVSGSEAWYICNGEDIIETTTVADVTSGQMDYYMIWAPLSAGASVVEAGTLS